MLINDDSILNSFSVNVSGEDESLNDFALFFRSDPSKTMIEFNGQIL